MSSVTEHLRFEYLCYQITGNGNNSEHLTNNNGWIGAWNRKYLEMMYQLKKGQYITETNKQTKQH